jgi:hypothetical protein
VLLLACHLLQTAIAEGLAHAIVSRRNPDGTPLPEFLHNKRILQLDVGLIIAGELLTVKSSQESVSIYPGYLLHTLVE